MWIVDCKAKMCHCRTKMMWLLPCTANINTVLHCNAAIDSNIRVLSSTSFCCVHNSESESTMSPSGNNSAPLPCRPKRTVTASSRLVDPLNTAEPIRSHKHAIELKRAAESTRKRQLEDMPVANGPPARDFDTFNASRNPPSSSHASPTAFSEPSPEPQTNVNQPSSVTGGIGSTGEGSEDEPTEHRK